MVVNSSTGLETAIKTARIEVRPGLAEGGVLQVKCVAEHPEVYWQSIVRNFSVDLPEYYHSPSSVSQGWSMPSEVEYVQELLPKSLPMQSVSLQVLQNVSSLCNVSPWERFAR